jgi:hypothetical protein
MTYVEGASPGPTSAGDRAAGLGCWGILVPVVPVDATLVFQTEEAPRRNHRQPAREGLLNRGLSVLSLTADVVQKQSAWAEPERRC